MSSVVASSVAAPPNAWEERLAHEAASARAVDFSADQAAGRDPVVRASFLRDLLLGFITVVDPSGKPEPIRLPIGLKARGFRLVDDTGGPGTLDLNDAQGRPAPALPPIRLEAVSFARLQARHARLGRLELLDCRFTSVDVEGAAIDGDVDLSGARALVGGGECTVSARNARIDGGFTMARARLRLTARKPVPKGESTRYALDLASSEVMGAVLLRPQFVAEGGARLQNALVRGDVRIDGGDLQSAEAHALNMQAADITGNLVFRNLDRDAGIARATAMGTVWLPGAKIGGDLDCSGARLDGRGREAIVATNAKIGGDIDLLAWNSRQPSIADTSLFEADGTVRLVGAEIGGDFDCSGAHLNGGGKQALVAARAKVTGSVLLHAWDGKKNGVDHTTRFQARGPVSLLGVRIGSTLDCDGALFDGGGEDALVATSAKIGGAVLLRAWDGKVEGEEHTTRFEASGTVSLFGAEIAGDLACDGARLDGGCGDAIDAQTAKVGGGVLLRSWDGTYSGAPHTVSFEATGRINALGTAVDGQMELWIVSLVASPFRHSPPFGTAIINLTEASIKSALLVHSIKVAEAEGPPPRPSHVPLALVDLRRTRISTLNDRSGRAWGDNIRLSLDGLVFDHVADQVDDGSARKAWLKRQYENGTPTRLTYRAQPHEHLAMVLDRQGANDAAREILADKLDIEARLSTWWQKPLWFIYWAMARYGLSGVRAMCTMGAYIVLGVILVKCAIAADMLVAEPRPDPTQEARDCGSNISTLVFVVDLALPVMKLGEEGRCTVRDADPKQLYSLISIPTPLTSDPNALITWWSLDLMKATVWRLLFATYAILGWIVTSITVLTLTGVLRRAAER